MVSWGVLNVATWKLDELGARWRAATPFPHLVLDDVVDPATLTALCQAVAQEPHWPNRGEIYDFMASAETVAHPLLREFAAELGAPATLAAVRQISGRPVERVDLRSYVYLAGSYLLPHADARASIGRLVAFAYYLWTGECEGGELELFDCVMDGDELVSATPAVRVPPRNNRLVLFEVTNASLHQVCEVVAGARILADRVVPRVIDDALRAQFRDGRCRHLVLPAVLAEDRAAPLRARLDAAGFAAVYEPDRGRYELNRELVDQPLFDELRALAEQLVERPLRDGPARWLRLRHRDYGLIKGDARDRAVAAEHLELTLDFSASTTEQAEIVYTDGHESWIVPQRPGSLAVVERPGWLFRYERYLNRHVEAAVLHRLRLSLPFG